jgi:hypothetical protein
MKRHRTIVSTLALAGLSALVPACALAGGPLLSGYGGPGAGAQAILGATLLNGPGGGAGSGTGSRGGSSDAGGPGASDGATSTTSGSGSAADANPGNGREPARGPQHGKGSTRVAGAGGASTGAAAAYLSPSRAGTSPAVAQSAGSSWFSGADLALLALTAGALVLTTLLTLRLARTQHR